jgi:phage shock protein A
MSESISVRAARLLSATLNSLVDSFENIAPDALMEQAAREIDRVIDDARSELGRYAAQKYLSEKRLDEEKSRYNKISLMLDEALKSGRDDLASAGISEQIDIEARIPALESAIGECAAREKELEIFIAALQSKKRDMRSEMAALKKTQEEQPPVSYPEGNNLAARAEKATDAFDRVMERASGIRGRSMDADSSAKLAELENLARKNRIAERLATLKAERS